MRMLRFCLFVLFTLFFVQLIAQTPEWVRSSSYVHPTLGETGSALDTDAVGNVIFAGEYIFGGTINGVTFLNGSSTVANCFVAAANSSGTFNWVMQISGGGSKAITDAKWSASGDALVCGYFSGTITAGSFSVTSAGALDMFLLRLSPAGVVTSLLRFGGLSNDYANSIDEDFSGRVFIAGSFIGSFTFGSTNLVSAGSEDACLLALSAGTTPLWAIRFGSSSFDRAVELVTDNSGAIYAVCEFLGSVMIGSSTYNTTGAIDLVLVKIQSDTGVIDWSIRSGGTSSDFCTGIDFDGVSTVFVGGNTSAGFQVGGFSVASSGCSDLFVFAISTSGTPLWLNIYGVAVTCESLSDLAFGAGGFLYLVGNFNANTTFGSVSLSLTGMNDAFIIKADPLGVPISVNKAGGTRNDLYTKVAVNDAGMVFVVGSIYGNTQIGTINTPVTGAVDAILVKYNTALLLPASVHFWYAQAKHAHETLFEWSTSEEVNTAWFVIEQSSDGINYSELHRTPARGTSFEWKDYAVSVEHGFRNRWYYRLVVEDSNGDRQWAGETEVIYRNEQSTVFYQPTRKLIAIHLPVYDENAAPVDIRVFDTSLKLLDRFTAHSFAELDTHHWPQGIYVITIGAGDKMERHKIAVY